MIEAESEMIMQNSEERMTLPILTKYEKARILGLRANQIIKGSPLFIDLDLEDLKKMTALGIAERELALRMIPFKIRRFFPDNTFEDWSLGELKECTGFFWK